MEEMLISAVYKRKALWDPSNGLRKNPKILKSLWAEVAREIGVDVNVAKNRWTNMRTFFMSQMRELEKPRSGCNKSDKTTSPWVFYNQLLFLKEVPLSEDDTTDDILPTAQTSSQALANDECPIRNARYPFGEVTVKEPTTNTIPTEKPTAMASQLGNEKISQKRDDNSGSQVESSSNNLQLSRALKRKSLSGNDGPSQKRSKEMMPHIEEQRFRLAGEDDNPDLLFFRSLIPYMEEFTVLQKLRIRSEIQDLVLAEHEAMQMGDTTKNFTSYRQAIMPAFHEPESSRPASVSSLSGGSD